MQNKKEEAEHPEKRVLSKKKMEANTPPPPTTTTTKKRNIIPLGHVIRDPRQNKQYTISKFLGTGTYSMCYAALEEVEGREGKDWVAIKFVSKKEMQTDTFTQLNVCNELAALERVRDHPHVIKLLHHFEDQEYKYLVLELCPGMSMKLFLKNKRLNPGTCSEMRTRLYIGQLLRTVQHLHSLNIIHRDIKLGNLLLDRTRRHIKLADFGMAEQLESPAQRLKLKCGTPHFVAPEVMHPEITGKTGYGFDVDTWSIGVCMYMMLVGKEPIHGDRKEVYEQLKNPIITFPETPKVSSLAKEVILGMLTVDPSKRWSIDRVLQHEFFAHKRESKTKPGVFY